MAVLKIFNPIVADEQKLDLWWLEGVDGISFSDIDSFVSSVPKEDNAIDIRLHCLGGSVSEGWAIVDKLRSTGKNITATIEGQCASMATVVLLAASVRRAYKHAQLLIHSPYIPEFTLADAYRAEDLDKMSADLKAESERMLDFYVDRTGADRAVLEALMKEDKFIDMNKAKELGFIQEITPPLSASKNKGSAAWQQSNSNQNKKVMTKQKSKIAKAFAMLGEALGVNQSIVAYELSTESGETLTIEKEEGEDPAVGDIASPDGEHLMPDGTTIVVEEGVITEIKDAEEEEPTEDTQALATANARIAELETEVATLKTNAKSSTDKQILNLVTVAGGLDWLKQAKSSYKPEGRQGGGKPAGAGGKQSLVASRLAKMQEQK